MISSSESTPGNPPVSFKPIISGGGGATGDCCITVGVRALRGGPTGEVIGVLIGVLGNWGDGVGAGSTGGGGGATTDGGGGGWTTGVDSNTGKRSLKGSALVSARGFASPPPKIGSSAPNTKSSGLVAVVGVTDCVGCACCSNT